MAKYIDKDAVVAEIEKVISGLRRNCNPNPLGNMQECMAAAEIEALNLIKDSLDTFEVKEVDFDAEWERYFEHRGEMATVNVKHLAKHFLELGLHCSQTDDSYIEGVKGSYTTTDKD